MSIQKRQLKLLSLLAPAALLVAALATAARSGGPQAPALPLPETVEFNRDVRPILSDNCYACHGFDKNKRKADLRLDTKEGILAAGENGPIVTPGKPGESELFRRIITDDPDERMPDPKSHKKLSERDVRILKKWIEQGAVYQGHWSYIKPAKPDVPKADPAGAPAGFLRNDVDRFILAKLKSQAMKPSAEADPVTLIRRVTLDLTGLPPTKEEVDAFVNDKSADAYEKVVDRLLASPAFGERMAMYWLDLVRYADSIGYHSDNPMNVAPYKEYVIHSFNANKPFDRFTVEQLAGDLLPNATTAQKVATSYNRLLQTTEEGGAQAKEYEQKNAADRVRNATTVWLGATVACAQCHDHKFDPIGIKDFYNFAAFFADVQEAAIGRREPGMPVPSGEQAEEIRKIEAQAAGLKAKLDTATSELASAQAEWEARQKGGPAVEWQTLEPAELKSAKGTKLATQPEGVVLAEPKGGKFPATEVYTVTVKTDLTNVTGFRLEAMADKNFPAGGPGVSPNGNFVLTEFKAEHGTTEGSKPKAAERKPIKLSRATADFSQNSHAVSTAIDGKKETGWAVQPEFGKPHTAVFVTSGPVGGDAETTLVFTLEFQSQYPQHQIGRFRLSATTSPDPTGGAAMPENVKAALAVAPDQRDEQQKKDVAAYYRTIAPQLQGVRDELAELDRKKESLLQSVPKCLVTTSGPPRTVRILPRGNWLDDSGEVVEPGVPAFLGELKTEPGKRATRLDLANWIVSKDNPLTARVFVNRTWKLFFGQGVSKVLDDLGSQGEWPTHPELLDWLAVDFQDSGWDVKRHARLLVTSGTYRQTSYASRELKEKDPYNRLYARQSRFRVDAETVRDNALAVSGLLVNKIGGPVAFPYQPAGYWFALNFPTREWKNDKGEGLYRRGLYTHWQRSFPHPSLLAFDAPSREEGTCERARSNIPQQALVLLNDPTYVEAARVFAEKIIKEGGTSIADRLNFAYGRALSRPPRDEEVGVLAELYAKHLQEYGRDKDAAQKLVSAGEAPPAKDLDPVEHAAWTSVARAILNLSETIMRY